MCTHGLQKNFMSIFMSPPHFCLLPGLTAGFAGCSTARAGLLLARPNPGLGLGAGRTASRGVSSAATAARSDGLACSSAACLRRLGYRAKACMLPLCGTVPGFRHRSFLL